MKHSEDDCSFHMLPFVIICKIVIFACRFHCTVSFWYSKPVSREVTDFARTYQSYVLWFRGITFFGMAFVSLMPPSVNSNCILKMFSNIPVEFSFSKYSFWKLWLLNHAGRLNTERVWAGAENYWRLLEGTLEKLEFAMGLYQGAEAPWPSKLFKSIIMQPQNSSPSSLF